MALLDTILRGGTVVAADHGMRRSAADAGARVPEVCA
jgi:hypothetical protein